MQEPQQRTAATQPFPIGDAIVPQYIDIPLEGLRARQRRQDFHAVQGRQARAVETARGRELAAELVRPDDLTMYICATDSLWGAEGGDPEYPVEPGALYSGSIVARVSAPRRGIFAALDVRTNRLVWRQQWTDTCYSGSIDDGRRPGVRRPQRRPAHCARQAAAANGSGNSKRTAASTRRSRRSSMTANSTSPSTRAARASPAASAPTACGCSRSTARCSRCRAARPTPARTQRRRRPSRCPPGAWPTSSMAARCSLQTCVACHGNDGTGGVHGAPLTTTTLSLAELMATIGNGREQMPAFGRALTPTDLHDVAAFILDRFVDQRGVDQRGAE